MKKLFTVIVCALLCSCATEKYSNKAAADSCPKWADNIHNKDNAEFIIETAFSLNIKPGQVTQAQFSERYLQW